MMAMMFAVSAATFAGDSEALKAIKKAKTYAEAVQLMANAQFANDQEKADAYNKLVDLAMAKVSKETGTIAENQAAAQLGTGKVEAYDTLGLGDAICDAIAAAVECNKYDQLPNAKGKVAPRYDKKNAERIWPVRLHLLLIGQDMSNKGDDAHLLKYWGAWLDSNTEPLFAEQDHEQDKSNLGQVAYWTGAYAVQAKDEVRANKYLDIAMQDSEWKSKALSQKMNLAGNNLKSKADSLQYAEQLKALYAENSDNDAVLEKLFFVYEGLKDSTAQTALLDAHLVKYPNSFIAYYYKGMVAVNANDLDKAVESFRKAADINPENAVIQAYLGSYLGMQASESDNPDKRKELYEEAVKALDKAKELDPDKLQAKWGYNRYQVYYNLYGEDDPRTKEAELDQ